MSTTPYDDLIAEVGRDLVNEIAPQEMVLYEANSQAYFDDPKKALQPQSRREAKLAMGGGVAGATFLTPIILAVLSDVAVYIGGKIKESAQAESGDLIADTTKELFKKFRPAKKSDASPAPKEQAEAEPMTTAAEAPAPSPEEIPTPTIRLTAEQLKEIHEVAYAKAIALHKEEDMARLLADAVVGQLVRAS
jgi:hypothetical protein